LLDRPGKSRRKLHDRIHMAADQTGHDLRRGEGHLIDVHTRGTHEGG
jgi:hypothetical protein